MQNQIQQFESKEFGKVRVVQKEGQPWFVGKDVAEALGYSNASKAVSTHVDAEDRVSEMIPTAQNGKLVSRTFIINESGLYSLILASKLPTARAFKRWVTSQILPTLRQHGAYIGAETLDRMRGDTEFTEELLTRLSVEHAKVGVLMDYVEVLQPKAQYYDAVLQCDQTIPATLIAKDYAMTTIAFNKLLHALGIQYRIGSAWYLYKEYADKGYTVTKTYYYANKKQASTHTEWTYSGRVFLYRLLAWYGILPAAERAIGA